MKKKTKITGPLHLPELNAEAIATLKRLEKAVDSVAGTADRISVILDDLRSIWKQQTATVDDHEVKTVASAALRLIQSGWTPEQD